MRHSVSLLSLLLLLLNAVKRAICWCYFSTCGQYDRALSQYDFLRNINTFDVVCGRALCYFKTGNLADSRQGKQIVSCTCSVCFSVLRCVELLLEVMSVCFSMPCECSKLCNIQGSHACWKIQEFLLGNFQNLEGPGESWNLLGTDVHGSLWFQIDMLMQTKIAIIVATRYVVWAAGMPKMLHGWGSFPDPIGRAYSALPDSSAAVCCYI